jgi:predicted dithiol-disulfide oxidoreductase (DUF899 family)
MAAAVSRITPWVKVGKPYIFEGPGGKETLAEQAVLPVSWSLPQGLS